MEISYYCVLSAIYHFIAISLISVVAIVILLHVISYFKRRKPVRLTKDSLVVLIGGCMGIGKVMALELAKKYQCNLIVADRRKDLFEELASEVEKHNTLIECFYCDLTDDESVDDLVKTLIKKNKNIDLLIYNAGIMFPKRTWEITEK